MRDIDAALQLSMRSHWMLMLLVTTVRRALSAFALGSGAVAAVVVVVLLAGFLSGVTLRELLGVVVRRPGVAAGEAAS